MNEEKTTEKASTDTATEEKINTGKISEFNIPAHRHNGMDCERVDEDFLIRHIKNEPAPTDYLVYLQNGLFYSNNYQDFAFSSDWKHIFFVLNNGVGYVSAMVNPQGIKSDGYLFYGGTGTQSITCSGAIGITYQYPYFFYFSAAEKTFYRCNDVLTGNARTELTFPADAPAGPIAIATNKNYIYVLDGYETVKIYTHDYANAQLTFVKDITLSDSDTKEYMAVDGTYIYTCKLGTRSGGSYPKTLCKYAKSDGQLISSLAIENPNVLTIGFKGMDIDPDGRLRIMIFNDGGPDSGSAADFSKVTISRINI